jgi:DNA-binding response OmpR family regulator
MMGMATVGPSDGPTDPGESAPTVLFVDDEPEILEMYDLLCRTEYTVFTADSGEEALRQFGDHIDIAFFDRRMPDMSGDEVISSIRDQGFQTPVGIISAVERDSGPDIETDTYLTKPITRDELFDAIEEHTS